MCMMERLIEFPMSAPAMGSIKYPIEKIIFAVNLPLKFFHLIVANAEIEGIKSLYTFFKMLYYMLV